VQLVALELPQLKEGAARATTQLAPANTFEIVEKVFVQKSGVKSPRERACPRFRRTPVPFAQPQRICDDARSAVKAQEMVLGAHVNSTGLTGVIHADMILSSLTDSRSSTSVRGIGRAK
jgi:hypothetical protein